MPRLNETGGIRGCLRRYEAWLAKQTPVNRGALRRKHAKMAKGRFALLRGSLPRWCEQWKEYPELAKAPIVPSVGDLHLDNFGTWRDAEQRLIWGVNDFDEAYPLPYTQDLVRLATSARLANADGLFRLSGRRACAEILRGYSAGIEHKGSPIVLEERYQRLRALTHIGAKDDPTTFWRAAASLGVAVSVPRKCRAIAREHWPADSRHVRWRDREGGLGSLGRARVVVIADHEGGLVGREFKALVPSAWAWASDHSKLHVAEVFKATIRSRDPAFAVSDRWITRRRFGPGTARIDLRERLPRRDVGHLSRCMGLELANVHLGDSDVRRSVRKDLSRRPANWLQAASADFPKRVEADSLRFTRVSRSHKRSA